MTWPSTRLVHDAAASWRGAMMTPGDALDRRLAQFREHTLPVAHHYREKGLLKEVDATDGRDAVFTRLYLDFHQEVLV